MSIRNPSFRPRKTILDLPLDGTVMSCFARHLKMEDILNLRLSSWTLRIMSDKILQMREVLHIGCCEKPIPYPLAVEYCRNLQIVHFYRTSNFSDEMLDVLTIRNCQIREFRVIECPRITCAGLYSLMRCQKLNHLEISDMVLQNRFLSAFARNFIHLQHVTLRNVHGFLGKNLATFFRKQTKLRSITLYSLLAFVRPSLLTIGSSCRELERLDVRNCKGVDDQGILYVATSCPKLRTFLISAHEPLQSLPNVCPVSIGTWANVSMEAVDYLARKNIRTRTEPQTQNSIEFFESDDLISESE